MLVLLLLASYLKLVSANVYCSTLIPPYAVPSLESCDSALDALEQENARCGPGNVIFSPTLSPGVRILRLPAVYVDSKQLPPASDLRCAISILWQPRPGARPAITSLDPLPFQKIINAAYSIRDHCIKSSAQYHPRLGRAWIGPHDWVDVQFGSVLGPRGLAANASDVGSRGLTVRLANGTNQTVASSMLGQIGDCGAATGFEDTIGAHIMKVS